MPFMPSAPDPVDQKELAALATDYPAARIITGCTHRYAVRLEALMIGQTSQWWECDCLAEVRARLVWALANR